MLIITRNVGETTALELSTGEIVNIKVVEIWGKQVRLGFEAPKSVFIERDNLPIEQRSEFKKKLNQPIPQDGNHEDQSR